jgi:hypothetical protein
MSARRREDIIVDFLPVFLRSRATVVENLFLKEEEGKWELLDSGRTEEDVDGCDDAPRGRSYRCYWSQAGRWENNNANMEPGTITFETLWGNHEVKASANVVPLRCSPPAFVSRYHFIPWGR